MKNLKLFLLAFVLLGCLKSSAQISPQMNFDFLDNTALLKHYSRAELQQLKTTDTLKFKTIVYYYTQSYILTPIPCSNGVCPDVDVNKFDVSKFEKYRLQNTRYIRDFDKYGYRLTLLSVDELEYKLPMHLD